MKSPCCDMPVVDVFEDEQLIEDWLECSDCGEQHHVSDVENHND